MQLERQIARIVQGHSSTRKCWRQACCSLYTFERRTSRIPWRNCNSVVPNLAVFKWKEIQWLCKFVFRWGSYLLCAICFSCWAPEGFVSVHRLILTVWLSVCVCLSMFICWLHLSALFLWLLVYKFSLLFGQAGCKTCLPFCGWEEQCDSFLNVVCVLEMRCFKK